MDDSIVSEQKLTDLFIPQAETIESVTLPYWFCHCFEE
jgi:hypothetical protein